jgi:glucose/arabinose dehydrogenase
MKIAGLPSRAVLLAGLLAGVAAFPVWAQQQPAANPSPPTTPTPSREAQPGGGPGSQPMTSAPPAAAPPAASAPPATTAQSSAPTPPPSWQQGRPESDAAVKLAPVAPPPLATPADKLPVAKLKLPKNFNLEVFASGVTNARTIRIGDKGTVFVSTRALDRVYAITDKNGKREVKTIATGLNSPNGLAFHKGTLYIAEINKISKIDNIEDQLDNPPKPTVIYDDLPSDAPHGWKFLTVGPDNRLYFNIGAPCNICMPSDKHAQIRSINLDGSDPKVVAKGIRQIVGMDWHPTLKQLYFTENQRDWLSEDLPEDKLNRITQPGKDNFGFPYCGGGNVPDPQFGWGHSCSEFTPPVVRLGPHSAPLGMRFYTGKMFPAQYRNAAFIARHGAWNQSHKIGGDVLLARLNPDGSIKSVEPFVTGFIEDNKYVGRPVDMELMKDGSILLSDDYNGAVYRITYGPQKVSMKR